MSKVLVTADWHIARGGCNWARRPEISGDTRFGMTQILKIARERDVEHIIVAGDVFDKRLQYADALYEMRWFLDELRRYNMTLYYVQGQHELSEPPLIAALAASDLAIHLDNHQVIINDKRVRGLDYQHPLHVQQALETLIECDVLVTHQVWKDFLSDDSGDAWISDIGGDPEIVITGDYHDVVTRKYGDKIILVPGPISLQRINEQVDKYVIILDERWVDEVVPLKSRKVFAIACVHESGVDNLIATREEQEFWQPQPDVADAVAKNILVFSLPSDCVADVEHKLAPLRENVHVFLDVRRPVTSGIPLADDPRRQAVEGGMEGCLAAFYKEDEDLYRDALQLLRSADVPEAIHSVFTAKIGDDSHNAQTDTSEVQ